MVEQKLALLPPLLGEAAQHVVGPRAQAEQFIEAQEKRQAAKPQPAVEREDRAPEHRELAQ